jgi:hypothetical protein
MLALRSSPLSSTRSQMPLARARQRGIRAAQTRRVPEIAAFLGAVAPAAAQRATKPRVWARASRPARSCRRVRVPLSFWERTRAAAGSKCERQRWPCHRLAQVRTCRRTTVDGWAPYTQHSLAFFNMLLVCYKGLCVHQSTMSCKEVLSQEGAVELVGKEDEKGLL